jgi:hypothetical protein
VRLLVLLLLPLVAQAQFASSVFGGSSPVGSSGGTGSASRRTTYAWYGDSLTAGACVSTPPPEVLEGLLGGGWDGTNRGVSGETADQIARRVEAGSATACLGEPCGYYVVQGAVNTLKSMAFNAEDTPEEVAFHALYGDVDEYGMADAVDHLLTARPTALVIWVGVLPYAGCNAMTCPVLIEPTARAIAYNAAMAEACDDRPTVRCVFPYAEFDNPGNPGFLLPALDCGDGIHHSQAGANLYAADVRESFP